MLLTIHQQRHWKSFHLEEQNRTEFKNIKIRKTLSSWSVMFMKLLQRSLASLMKQFEESI